MNPYYFECNEGFELVGNPIVVCGVRNTWINIEKSPTCKPIVTCPLTDKKRLLSLGLVAEYENLFDYNGTKFVGIQGSRIFYTCIMNPKDSSTPLLLGDAVRICGKNGTWIGEEPSCSGKLLLFRSKISLNISSSLVDLTRYSIYVAELNEAQQVIPRYSDFASE